MRRVGFVLAGALLVATMLRWEGASAQFGSEYIHQDFVILEGPYGEEQRAHIIYPRRRDALRHPPGQRYPLLVALHGRGESDKPIDRGANGWLVDYWVHQAFGAFGRRRIETVDLRGMATEEHLGRLNAELREAPFAGAMLVTPYVPDLMAPGTSEERVEAYSDWLAGPLLAAVRREFPQAARTRGGTGIDGVSMGGWVALEAGFRNPEVFGAVGAIQPAITGREERLADAARTAAETAGPQRIRLLSSERDGFLESTRALSQGLRERRVSHSLTVVPGGHGYDFNRGPGSIELLRFGERSLVREPYEP